MVHSDETCGADVAAHVSEAKLARRLLKSFGAQGMQLAVRTVQQVGLMPVLLAFWGSTLYETWIVVAALAAMVPLAELGTQAYFGNRLLAAWVEGGKSGLSAALSLAVSTQTVLLGCCLAVICLALIIVDPGRLVGAQADTRSEAVTALALLSLGNLAAVPLSTISAVYRARGDFSRFVNFATLMLVLEVLSVLLAAVCGGGIRMAAGAFLLTIGLSWLLLLRDLKRHYPDIRWSWRPANRTELKDILRFAPLYSVNSAANIVAVSAPVFLLKEFANPGAVLAYTAHRLLTGLLRQISFQMAHAIAAEMARQFLRHETTRLRKLFLLSGALTSLVYGAAAGLLVAVAHPLIVLWTHANVVYDPVLLGIFLGASFACLPGQVALTFFYYVNQPAPVSVAHGANVVLGVALCVLLVPSHGVAGAALAIGGVEFLTVGLWLTRKACKATGVSTLVFLATSWLAGLLAFGISSLVADFVAAQLHFDGPRAFLIAGVAWFALMSVPALGAVYLLRLSLANRRRIA